jgi:hypothetical protein
MKYLVLFFVVFSSCGNNGNLPSDAGVELCRNQEILGKWLVVDASTIPFDHISFCKNLSINSVFEFRADSTLKVWDSNTGDYCNLELSQYFSFKENTLHITEYDMIFNYQVNLLTQDSLILKINSIPQRFITEAMELGEMRDKEVLEIYENGILVTLTRIKNGE